MATQEPMGVWLRDGDLIYMLEGTRKYIRGEEVLRNKFTVRISPCHETSPAEEEALRDKIFNFLQQNSTNSTTTP